MSKIQAAIERYRQLGLSYNSVIAGSGALAIWDEIARARHYTPILPEGRIIGDLDIYTGKLNHAFHQVVHNANLAVTHECGTQDCATFDLDGERYDVSCEWPFMVASSGNLDDISQDVGGIRVMTIGRVADSKRRFARTKDAGDLRQIEQALGFRRH